MKRIATYLPSINAYVVKFPYDEKLVALIKKIVPISDRHYNAETHHWIISNSYFVKINSFAQFEIVSQREFENATKTKV